MLFKAISRNHNNNNLYSTLKIEFMHVLRITIHLLIPGGYRSRSRQSKPSLPGCQIRRHLRFIAYIFHFFPHLCGSNFFLSFGGGARPPLAMPMATGNNELKKRVFFAVCLHIHY